MQKKLGDLLNSWGLDESYQDLIVTGISSDTRKLKPGDLFLITKNNESFFHEAINLGAVAFAYDLAQKPQSTLPCIFIADLNQHAGEIASHFYDEPSKNLTITGVTGTNGKTTVAYLLAQAYALLGEKARYVGTLGVGDTKSLVETGMTTPDAIDLQRICQEFAKEGTQQLAIEVSSHGLCQYRLSGMDVQYAIFTNLTHDHLDYHGTLENYATAKARLFSMPKLKAMVLNADSPWHQWMLKTAHPSAQKLLFAVDANDADVKVMNTSWTLQGMEMNILSPWGKCKLKSNLLGHFNVYNILAVFSILMAQGFEKELVLNVISKLLPVPGRMEVISLKPLVVVDYAHTPDALENVLQTLKQYQKDAHLGRLWVVFGCGGDRDMKKRPIMGKIACDLADKVVVTSDNPRFENPTQIIQQITQGLDTKAIMQIEDRKLAITSALDLAAPDDIILIAGKGHETYQIIGAEKIHFSDQEIVREHLQRYNT